MKRKFVSRALPSVLVAGGLIVAGTMSASAADESTSNAGQSTGGLGGVLTGTVDAVVGEKGAVNSTLNQVTDTVGQVTKKDGAVDDTVKGVTGVVDSVAGKNGAVDDVVGGVTGAGSDAVTQTSTKAAAPKAANDGGPVEDVVGGVSGALNAVAGENGAVDDVLGADAPEQGVTDNLPSEILGDVGSIGESLGNADLPGTIDNVANEDGVVDDLLESPELVSSPGDEQPGGELPGGELPGGELPGGELPGGGDTGGALPGGDSDDGYGLVPGAGVTPIEAGGEARTPAALAQTGADIGDAAGAAAALGLAGAGLIAARRWALAKS